MAHLLSQLVLGQIRGRILGNLEIPILAEELQQYGGNLLMGLYLQ